MPKERRRKSHEKIVQHRDSFSNHAYGAWHVWHSPCAEGRRTHRHQGRLAHSIERSGWPLGSGRFGPVLAWVDLFNKEGFKIGNKTYNFQLIIADDKNTPEGGAAAAKKLIYEDRVKFLIGHWSWNYPSVSAVANQAKVIYLCRTGNEAVPGGVYNPKQQPYTVFANPSHELFISDIHAIVEAFPNYKR
jgi:hypothetical protein